jgi:hypothetical protein
MTTTTMGTWNAAIRRYLDEPEFAALLERARTIQLEQERRDGNPRSQHTREIEVAAVAVHLDRFGERS